MKPILIAHRGNLYGPEPKKENRPDHIQQALILGFQVEVDVWMGPEPVVLCLGHDGPQYPVSLDFLADSRIWVHAKDTEALEYLLTRKDINCFYLDHNVPSIVLTSQGYVWTYLFAPMSFAIYGNDSTCANIPEQDVLGICSDYVGVIKQREEESSAEQGVPML